MTEKELPVPKLKLETACDLLTKDSPAMEWLIENVWVDKSRGLIAGNPGVGKTWIALDMLISVATGQLCMGKFAVKQGNVLLVEEESSELNLSRRFHALARARGLSPVDLSHCYYMTRQFVKLPRDLHELYWLIAEHDIRLVVFDSLRRFHSGDENSSTEMQVVLDAFARINALSGASLVLIHHLAKSHDGSPKSLFERMRGSGDLWAWRDCVLGIEGEEESTSSTCTFQFRDADAPPPLQIERVVNDATGAITIEAKSLEETTEFAEKAELILEFMKTQFGSCPKETIFKAVKGRKQDFVRVFRMLEKQKIVAKNGLGWVIYHVPK